MPNNDEINNPPHYTQGRIEVIEFIEDQKFGYHAGNAIKYISRYRHKGTPEKDIRKAIWYLNRLLLEVLCEGSNTGDCVDADSGIDMPTAYYVDKSTHGKLPF